MYFQKIDRLIFKSFIGPYVASFLIAEFVLIMQFLWKYIDNILGKGVPVSEIMIVIGYFSIKILPQAIPISILLSSVFVFGNMAERFELTSMKSSGMSFFRILRSGLVLAVMTMIISVLTSNIFAPRAEYLYINKFEQILKQKSTLFLEPGKINNDFSGFSIYVGDKDDDDRTIYNVLIYDENGSDPNLINIISAECGIMSNTSDGAYLVMNLYDGVQYREVKDKNSSSIKEKVEKLPFTKTRFERLEKVFDMSQFQMEDNGLSSLSAKEKMLNSLQLVQAIDSLHGYIELQRDNLHYDYLGMLTRRMSQTDNAILEKYGDKTKSTKNLDPSIQAQKNREKVATKLKSKDIAAREQRTSLSLDTLSSFLYAFPDDDISELRKESYDKSKRRMVAINSIKMKMTNENNRIDRYLFRLHQKYSWAVICLIFLFIGAPMGSIIRKGGFGYPLLVAILFFVFFVILDIVGQRVLQSRAMHPILAAWLPCIVITPASVLLSYMAIKDFHSFNWSRLWTKLIPKL